jgi:predicted phosphodiesterase
MTAVYNASTGVNHCTLTSLASGAVYYYRASAGGTQALGSFVTAPPAGTPFNFVVIGDTRTDTAGHQAVIDAVLDRNPAGMPDLFFNTGDLVESGAIDSQWDTYFTIEGELLANTVFGPVVGNHDAGIGSKFDTWFTTGSYYWFFYGNAVFVVLNTDGTYGAGSAQYTMAETALAAAAADPAIDFKFVLFHKPGVTTGEHDPDATIVDDYLDLFEQYNVDVVFNGHNHIYEHGLVNGVHYVVTGGGGVTPSTTYETRDWTVYVESTRHFCTVDVTDGGYHMVAYRTDGTGMDAIWGTTAGGGVPGDTPPDLQGNGGWCGIAPASDHRPGAANLALVLLAWVAIPLIRRRR